MKIGEVIQKQRVDAISENAALLEGSALWKDSISQISEFEDELRPQLQAVHEDDDVARRMHKAMEKVIVSVTATLKYAEGRGWRLLVVGLANELEAFKQGQAVLAGLIKKNRQGMQVGGKSWAERRGSGVSDQHESQQAEMEEEEDVLLRDDAFSPTVSQHTLSRPKEKERDCRNDSTPSLGHDKTYSQEGRREVRLGANLTLEDDQKRDRSLSPFHDHNHDQVDEEDDGPDPSLMVSKPYQDEVY